ncbi:MAG: NAD(P)/FAD-dependent oxidoreductase, partial [Geminicoccaceae bacterium]
MKLVPYWLDTAELFADAIEGPVEGRADVVVIGAGLNGLAAALTLSKKGVDVVLLDKARVGSSASGRNGGMCTTGLAIGYLTAVERYGAETAMRYYEAYCDAIDTVEQLVSDEGIACHFSRTGRLTLADKPAHFEGLAKTHAALASNGYDTTLVPPDKLRDEIGSDRYHGGVVDPRGAGLHVG